MELTEIEQKIRVGLKKLMKKAELLWPGERAQVLERNLTHYVGAGMMGFGVVYEYPFRPERNAKRWKRLDMVAFDPSGRVLVLAESKRLLKEVDAGVARVKGDVEKIKEASKKLRCWNYGKGKEESLCGAVTLGVLLVSVSGDRRVAAQRREKLSSDVGLGGWPTPVSHSDGTYHALYKVWKLKPRRAQAGRREA